MFVPTVSVCDKEKDTRPFKRNKAISKRNANSRNSFMQELFVVYDLSKIFGSKASKCEKRSKL